MPTFEIKRFGELEYQAKEAINTLCTNLSFAGGDIKKIMITSCHPQEGKSFVSMNLMRGFARLGMRVVLVDADIRASALQRVYGIHIDGVGEDGKYPGLTRYLGGRCSVEEILGRTNIPNASMILAGRTVTNSLPLLNTPRLKHLLDALASQFDVVLVDAPPVGTIIDAAKIATACDGTLFVVESGTVSRSHFQRAYGQIEKTGCSILGTVLNRYDDLEYGGKYYYYSGGHYGKYGRYGRYGGKDDPYAGKSSSRQKSSSGSSAPRKSSTASRSSGSSQRSGASASRSSSSSARRTSR